MKLNITGPKTKESESRRVKVLTLSEHVENLVLIQASQNPLNDRGKLSERGTFAHLIIQQIQ